MHARVKIKYVKLKQFQRQLKVAGDNVETFFRTIFLKKNSSNENIETSSAKQNCANLSPKKLCQPTLVKMK